MNANDHPFIAEVIEFARTDDAEAALAQAQANFLQYDPATRTALLKATRAALLNDDSVPLKQRAQLLTFTREIERVDRAMYDAGR